MSSSTHGRLAVAPEASTLLAESKSPTPTGAYDHQPDVAPDGQSVVFTRYDGKAFELWRLDLETGREHAR